MIAAINQFIKSFNLCNQSHVTLVYSGFKIMVLPV